MNLAERLRQGAVPHRDAALLVAEIADALHYAHGQNVFHRDIKPGNILLDRNGRPYITDFGLAVHEDDLAGEAGRRSGTLPYYSPEQARGEGHRIDGRTDVYGLGVVLYELLSGRHPFEANSKEQLVDQILHREAKPPRQLRDSIPRELERICLKALAKRITDRYTTAKDMADELRAATQQLSASPGPLLSGQPARARWDSGSNSESMVLVTPRGLRSFGSEDQEFFLDLLPGPRDRDGLPESVRFWKQRIERSPDEETFPVGLIYGPSGCGKSSLVKAGLLPRLAPTVRSIYIESTRSDTELRLMRSLRRTYRDLGANLSLPEMIATLRRADGVSRPQKLLIVLDQFEQWLHARGNEHETELLAALRQCDGGRVQCVLMVRDDFWIAISRFMQKLEVRLQEGDNIALVDLFDPAHARKVLIAFGRAFGRLPNDSALPAERRKFVDLAVESLARNGDISPVRLSLFCEMLKKRDWIPATLRQVGGVEGLGVTFLEETFTSRGANPDHRAHAQAARSVLRSLLPEHGVEIKGFTRSYRDLLEASGYKDQPPRFDSLLQVLDNELRMITPSEAEAALEPNATTRSGAQSYQLAHDYLIPTIRHWLTQKQRETRRGRAELLLADRAELWNARREGKQLPSLWEYTVIRLLVHPARCTEVQKSMMRAASRYYLVRFAVVIPFLLLGVAAAFETKSRITANSLVTSLLRAETTDTPQILHELEPAGRWAVRRLRNVTPASPRERLHHELALHRLGADPSASNRLIALLDRSSPSEARIIAGELRDRFSLVQSQVWDRLKQAATPGEMLATATVAAACDPHHHRWNQVADAVAEQVAVMQPDEAIRWMDNLLPVAGRLTTPLEAIFLRSDPNDRTGRQSRATTAAALARFLQDDPHRLARLLIYHSRHAGEFQSLLRPLLASPRQSAELVRAISTPTFQNEPVLFHGMDHAAAVEQFLKYEQSSNRLIALALLGESSELLDCMSASDDCTLRSTLIHRLGDLAVGASDVVAMLESENRADVRAALVLAFGEYSPGATPKTVRQRIVDQLNRSWQSSHSEEHAAANWLIHRWQFNDESPVHSVHPTQSNWFTAGDRTSFSIVRGELNHDFALAGTEVTIEQFRRFQPNYVELFGDVLDHFVDREMDRCPAIYVTCYEAMQYCNWLTLRDGMSEADCCYETLPDGTVQIKRDHLARAGYRLPTFEEWRIGCTGGSKTPFNFGSDLRLLPHYAWYFSNSRSDGQHRVRPVGSVKPNTLGLHDMCGNAWEWFIRMDSGQWSLIGGGSCDNDPIDLQRVDQEKHLPPGSREIRVGFRLAKTVSGR